MPKKKDDVRTNLHWRRRPGDEDRQEKGGRTSTPGVGGGVREGRLRRRKLTEKKKNPAQGGNGLLLCRERKVVISQGGERGPFDFEKRRGKRKG